MPARGTLPLRVHIELHPPLLYWADRRQWMWHKKWALPTLTVRVERLSQPDGTSADGAAASSTLAALQNGRLYVLVNAGTMRDESTGLENQGLGGDCQRVLQLGPNGAGEVSFGKLLFQHTSFNCSNQPFHLVVALLAVPERGAAAGTDTDDASARVNGSSAMQPLACFCSSPVRVDARKRSKGERPEASADDVRLVSRQRPTGGGGSAAALPSTAPAAASAASSTYPPVPGAGGAPSGHNDQSGATAVQALTDGDGGIDLRFSARALMDATSDAVVVVRADGVIVQILSSTVFGYTPSQLLGRSFLTICQADEHPGLLQTMQALLAMNAGYRHASGLTPRTIRMLHRVVVGLGVARTAQTVAVDSIMSVASASPGSEDAPETLLLCCRRALPVGLEPSDPAFSFRIFPWPS